MSLIVESRPDPRRGELPLRFGWPGRMLRVNEVLDSWIGERHRDFRVIAEDRAVYILRHDLDEDTWRIHFFRQDPGAGRDRSA